MIDKQKSEEIPKGQKEDDSERSPAPTVNTSETPHSQTEQDGQTKQTRDLAEQIKHTDRVIAWSAGITAVLTFVLAILAGVQAYSFIESERAYIIVTAISFRHAEPTLDTDGLDLVVNIKNVGKHIGLISTFNIKPLFFSGKTKILPEMPQYDVGFIEKVVPPILPDSQTTVNVHLLGILPLPHQPKQEISNTSHSKIVVKG